MPGTRRSSSISSSFAAMRPLSAAQAESLAETEEATRKLADDLARGWPRRKAVRAVIGHALEFETWRSLVRRHGLARKQAVDAMTSLVVAEFRAVVEGRRADDQKAGCEIPSGDCH